MVNISTGFIAEAAALDSFLEGHNAAAWTTPTPAKGWTVAHQIGHLAWTDEMALTALRDDAAFSRYLDLARAEPDFVDTGAEEWAALPPAELMERWRAGRVALADALDRRDPQHKVPWFGPSMSPRSMATARLMEVWAHSQDVHDALGGVHEPTERLRDVAHIGVRTRDYAYRIHGLTLPEHEFHIAVTGPNGDPWTWGPEDAEDRVIGSAEEFCLVVTQRRKAASTDLDIVGAEARRWMTIAQAFASTKKNQAQNEEAAQ